MASYAAIRTCCSNLSRGLSPIARADGKCQQILSQSKNVRMTSSFQGARKPQRMASVFGVAKSASKFHAWFKFGKNGLDAEGAGIYASQGREDYSRDDVEHYFHYMGMLAVEGGYDSIEELLDAGIHAVDLLLLLAATEGDQPKIQELLRAGADASVKDLDGKTALDRAANDEIRDLIREGAMAVV